MARLNPDEDLTHLRTKTVTAYDRNGKLALPVSLMDHLWPDGEPYEGLREFDVLDINRMTWHLVCKLRRNQRGNPKPEVYGREWRRCIQEKNIRVGDQLAFYLPPPGPPPNQAGPPVFVISVKKEVIRLLGTTIFEHV